jgi:peptide-methionine (S)-S-oxide reductase
MARQQATLGGGCFWCIEAVYNQLQGVESAISGYAGGRTKDPSYEAVCSGTTGHAEVVQVTFDPDILTFRDVLEVFFSVHDPTTLNAQGADVGTQYRSIILTHSKEQDKQARAMIAEMAREQLFDGPIVTQVEPLTQFFAAEDYHQEYYVNNPGQGYCRAVIRPKLDKFRKNWAKKLKA